MGSIVRHGTGWRAHLHVAGRRESKLFRTRREAETWAVKREAELAGGGSSLTFAEAAERWLAWKLPRLDNADNQRTVEQSIREHVLPDLGARKLSELHRKELVAVVKRLADAGKIETAHRVGQRIRAILDHAVDHGDIESHPGDRLSRVLPAAAPRRMRAVSAGEIPALMRAIEGYPEPFTRAGLLLLAHTFVRTSELLGARWGELVSEDTWVIPAERMKLRLPHVVPLSSHVRAIIADLRRLSDDSPYLLPGRAHLEVGRSNNTLLSALYRLGYRHRMTGHGFRALASTVLNESGLWNRDAVERQLAHRETDRVREVYHRAEYLDERRRMMDWYSDYLAERASSTHS
jgi:integrase